MTFKQVKAAYHGEKQRDFHVVLEQLLIALQNDGRKGLQNEERCEHAETLLEHFEHGRRAIGQLTCRGRFYGWQVWLRMRGQ